LLEAGDAGRFLDVCSAFISATFAYLGCEIVGVTVGEAKDPRKTIPKAVKLTLWRIVGFYVFLVLLVGMLVPYNSQNLSFAIKGNKPGAAASPFVVAMKEQGVDKLPGVVNACILLFVISASNSDFYISSRTLYSLAKEGDAPVFLTRTSSRGVPLYCLGVSALFGCVAFMNIGEDSKVVFSYLVSAITIFGLVIWISILISHICFVKGRKAQGIEPKSMPYTAPLGAAGSYFALALCILIVFIKNYDTFIHNPKRAQGLRIFDYKTFISGYIGVPVSFGSILMGNSKNNRSIFCSFSGTSFSRRQNACDQKKWTCTPAARYPSKQAQRNQVLKRSERLTLGSGHLTGSTNALLRGYSKGTVIFMMMVSC